MAGSVLTDNSRQLGLMNTPFLSPNLVNSDSWIYVSIYARNVSVFEGLVFSANHTTPPSPKMSTA